MSKRDINKKIFFDFVSFVIASLIIAICGYFLFLKNPKHEDYNLLAILFSICSISIFVFIKVSDVLKNLLRKETPNYPFDRESSGGILGFLLILLIVIIMIFAPSLAWMTAWLAVSFLGPIALPFLFLILLYLAINTTINPIAKTMGDKKQKYRDSLK